MQNFKMNSELFSFLYVFPPLYTVSVDITCLYSMNFWITKPKEPLKRFGYKVKYLKSCQVLMNHLSDCLEKLNLGTH